MIHPRLRPVAAFAAAVSVAALCTACSGGGSAKSPSAAASGARPTGSNVVAATRWWSDAAGSVGSTVGPNAAATALSPSRDVYCSILRQTMAAGKSVLPGATASDPALVTTTEAFVSELQKVAPAEVSGPWTVLGPVLVSVVKSGGELASLRAKVDANAVAAAAKSVATDARSRCHLELTR